MPTWDEVKQMVKGALTPQERYDAGRALAEHIPEGAKDKSLAGLKKGCINIVKLGALPERMAKEPALHKAIKKVIGGRE